MPLTYGGTFAPPFTDEKLADYKALAESPSTSPEVSDAMLVLHACIAQWWELPESNGAGKPHISGRGVIVPLEAEIAKTMFDAIPWKKELDAYATLFDGIDNGTDKPLRDAAFHLLWGVNELNLDREPMTTDKL